MNSIPYLFAIGIPIIFIIIGGLAKKLVRGPGWDRKDFFLGIQSTLATISAQLVYLYDIVKDGITSNGLTVNSVQKLALSALSFLITIPVLFLVLILHQEWGQRNNNRKGQIVWLGIIANLIGAGLLVGFLLAIKGVK
jgi:hypothetical protein